MLKFRKKKSLDFFVSIGAGVNQIPLIIEAKKANFQVIGVDINASAPGFYHCDLKIQESIQDYQNIYIKLRELLVDGKISAIMTKSYGNAIITTSFLCEKFGLPFIPFEESKKFLNKKTTRKIYSGNGIAVPNILPINLKTRSSSVKDSAFPVIAKPQTGHAKTNVRLLKNHEELTLFQNEHQGEDFIFETFLEGDEIICAGLVHQQKYYNIMISDKKTSPRPYFADIMHSTPSVYSHLDDKISEIGQKIAEAFNIQTSPMIMEFVVDRNENLFLLESVPEFGGEFIPDIMIPAATGYNHIRNAINAATGEPLKFPLKKSVSIPVVVKYITGEHGTLASCNPDPVKKIDGIVFSRIFKDIGAKISPPETNHDRLGVIVAKGKTVEDAARIASRAESSMNIRIVKENNDEN
ncbi:MAG TPA: ATP-grasp domain-containing protein [Spirochaetota bacterium]|nr:ATP-grasp domain-containing protein [Spirochaetota bacterium]HPJ33659.1 ATP-grasp domain-containing protein [Spirochaetota bacterium]